MAKRLLFAAGAGLMLAACQSAPKAPVITLADRSPALPVSVAASVSDRPTEGLTTNDWGGEVPQTKPAGAVSEGGLGDLD